MLLEALVVPADVVNSERGWKCFVLLAPTPRVYRVHLRSSIPASQWNTIDADEAGGGGARAGAEENGREDARKNVSSWPRSGLNATRPRDTTEESGRR